MSWLYFLVRVISALSCIVVGRLGEDVKQCEARYGGVAKRKDNTIQFLKAGLVVACVFEEGKCVQIHYHSATFEGGVPTPLTEGQIARLLKSYGDKWEVLKQGDNPFLTSWITDALLAVWDEKDRVLTIMTQERITQQVNQQREKEQKNLEGF